MNLTLHSSSLNWKRNLNPINSNTSTGFKHPNTLHTHLRVGRSFLNCHLFPIGLSITKACQCGHYLESIEHYFLDCKLYDHARAHLMQKLEGLLENKPNSYSKKNLCQILLCGEKPHLPEKYSHNKHIFFAVQTFITRSKRMFFNEQNKPNQYNGGIHWSLWNPLFQPISLTALIALQSALSQPFFSPFSAFCAFFVNFPKCETP